MAVTGASALTAFSQFIGDYWSDTVSAAGNAGGTTLVDTDLSRWGDDAIRDMYLRIVEPCHATEFQERRISSYDGCLGVATVLPAFTAQIGANVCYELHRYDPAEKFRALDQARLQIVDDLFIVRRNDTLTGDGRQVEFCIPSNIRLGPFWAIPERVMSVCVGENLLRNGKLCVATNWTSSNVTTTTQARCNHRDIPKQNETSVKHVVAACTNGTFTQVAACMAFDCVASIAADREVNGGLWYYSTEVCKVRLNIIDDVGTSNGSFHTGNGWEYITVDRTIAGNNATTFSLQVCIASTANAFTGYAEKALFRFGDIPCFYPDEWAVRVERDDTIQKVRFRQAPLRGVQVRLLGKAPLSALGCTLSTQVTNSYEVDCSSAQLLYAKAAEILFGRDLLNTPGFRDIGTRIQLVNAQAAKLRLNWTYQDRGGRIITPFHR